MPEIDWASILRDLDRYQCPCGAGGPMACAIDCPGDTRDGATIKAIHAIIATLEAAKLITVNR